MPGVTSTPNLRKSLLRAFERGERSFSEWRLGRVEDGVPCFEPGDCRIVTAIPSQLISLQTISVMVDLPPGISLEAQRVKFFVTQTGRPKVEANVIQWHVRPSALDMETPITIVSFGFDLDTDIFPGCLLRRYPALIEKPHGAPGINPLHWIALGIYSQEMAEATFEKFSDEDVERALEEGMGELVDPELIDKVLLKSPQDLDPDDFLALIRFRTPHAIALACNKLILSEYDIERLKIPQALALASRRLLARRVAY